MRYRQGIGRLVAKPPQHVALAPVAASTQYVKMNVPRKSGQLVITPELTNVFHQADVLELINKYGLAIGPLNYVTDLEFARVQHFAAALRTPRKKEQIVSIRWRATQDAKGNRFGMAVWGVFVREGNGLKPIHLVANRAAEDDDEFEVLAVGDLNGDGIDELIARVFVMIGSPFWNGSGGRWCPSTIPIDRDMGLECLFLAPGSVKTRSDLVVMPCGAQGCRFGRRTEVVS